MVRHIYIMGTRGIPAAHGGFETFAEKLALFLVGRGWKVTVYCQNPELKADTYEDDWNGIHRVHVAPGMKGPLGTGIYDAKCFWHLKDEDKGVVLTLGYNTAFFNILPKLWKFRQAINMDGIEWERGKWSWFYKKIFKINYKIAGRVANTLIADHPEIEKILLKDFDRKKIKIIPYGANVITSANADLLDYYKLTPKRYMIVIARPEPENNILMIVKTWSRKYRNMKLVVLGDYRTSEPYKRQVRKAASDEVIFPGAIYRPEVVNALRFNALAYIHGHSVGGTNPSLLEAMGAGNPIVAHDNKFNRWVANDAAIYFETEDQLDYLLANLPLNEKQLRQLSQNSWVRHNEAFQWESILDRYENILEELLPNDQRSLKQ